MSTLIKTLIVRNGIELEVKQFCCENGKLCIHISDITNGHRVSLSELDCIRLAATLLKWSVDIGGKE